VIEATKVTDSISEHGVRLLTMKLRYPKMIHGEFMTHRVFSRNASSSRAVPTAKLIEEVRSSALRAVPVSWGQNQKGMQAGGELTGDTLRLVQECWSSAANDAAHWAEKMSRVGAHKQVVNRILEPYTHINTVVTSTKWWNFFGLRLDKAAQPEMRVLAEAMWVVFNESAPLYLGHGQWHLPFVDSEDIAEISSMHGYEILNREPATNYPAMDMDLVVEDTIKVSVARCARVSYESHETGKRSMVEADIKLHDFLLMSRHLSPFEHQATPDEPVFSSPRGSILWRRPEEHGNFVGWRQRRKQISDEAIAPLPEEDR
jgi:thymidylate synthase ThyX